uniref:Uncharacterized protein n=1 Tax=Ciona intestinalis TaxID=7719 RepID=H2XM52_CIOIN
MKIVKQFIPVVVQASMNAWVMTFKQLSTMSVLFKSNTNSGFLRTFTQ